MIDQSRQDAIAFNYRNNVGETMVYGPLFITAIAVLGFFSRGIVELLWAIPIAVSVALFHLPMLNKKRPPILAEERGLFLDGVGLIPWSAIRATSYKDRILRSIRYGQITIALTGPVDVVLSRRDDQPFWRRFQTKLWSTKNRDLIVDLRSIEGDHHAVYETLERFRRG